MQICSQMNSVLVVLYTSSKERIELSQGEQSRM